jgi:hypothetical protein
MNPKLQKYLEQLEQHLYQLSPGQRSEIIIQVQQNIEELIESTQGQILEEVLQSFGPVSQLAKKYVMERGLQYQELKKKSPISPLKWLVIGFLSFVTLCFIFAFIMYQKITPLIEINEETGQVKILGGLIDLQEDLKDLKVQKTVSINQDGKHQIAGEHTFDIYQFKTFEFNFDSGQFIFLNSLDNIFSYQCESDQFIKELHINYLQETVRIDLAEDTKYTCKIKIPENIQVKITGDDGQVKAKFLKNPTDIHLENGKIGFSPHLSSHYQYDINIETGSSDSFHNSQESNHFLIQLSVKNGIIKQI